MRKLQDLQNHQKRKLAKALNHLQYSYSKIQQLPTDADLLDEESLETWESFAVRFARVADIFITRYLRTYVLLNDPGFSGSLRDFINQAEKIKLIDNADHWLAIRELRNITAHEYSEDDLTEFFKRLKNECPKLLSLTTLLQE